MKYAALVLVVLLSGCASLIAETPAQRVYAIQADYNGPLAAAVKYESQPRCTEGQSQLEGCSDPEVVSAIRKADNDVNAAIQAAQKTVRTPGVSDSNIKLAITTLRQAIAAFEVILANHNIEFEGN
jgi:hypothetical protein